MLPERSLVAATTGALNGVDSVATKGVVAAQPDVVAADLGMTEPDALLLLAVDPTQHRVDVYKGQYVDAGQQRHPPGQADQCLAGRSLQLPYVPVREARRNNPSVDGAHTLVNSDRMPPSPASSVDRG